MPLGTMTIGSGIRSKVHMRLTVACDTPKAKPISPWVSPPRYRSRIARASVSVNLDGLPGFIRYYIVFSALAPANVKMFYAGRKFDV